MKMLYTRMLRKLLYTVRETALRGYVSHTSVTEFFSSFLYAEYNNNLKYVREYKFSARNSFSRIRLYAIREKKRKIHRVGLCNLGIMFRWPLPFLSPFIFFYFLISSVFFLRVFFVCTYVSYTIQSDKTKMRNFFSNFVPRLSFLENSYFIERLREQDEEWGRYTSTLDNIESYTHYANWTFFPLFQIEFDIFLVQNNVSTSINHLNDANSFRFSIFSLPVFVSLSCESIPSKNEIKIIYQPKLTSRGVLLPTVRLGKMIY